VPPRVTRPPSSTAVGGTWLAFLLPAVDARHVTPRDPLATPFLEGNGQDRMVGSRRFASPKRSARWQAPRFCDRGFWPSWGAGGSTDRSFPFALLLGLYREQADLCHAAPFKVPAGLPRQERQGVLAALGTRMWRVCLRNGQHLNP
jgi:hypothetical protein